MELRHLRYFVAAAEDENFNRAAERLSVSQPALSRRIGDLEAELGVTLFHRRNKHVALAQCGKFFYNDVKRILDDLDTAKRNVRNFAQGELGTLTIGLNESVARHKIVSQALQAFSSKHPKVQLRLDPIGTTSLVDAVLTGAVDAVILYSRPQNDAKLDYLELARDSFVVALPKQHPLSSKKRVTLADLRGEKFIWYRREIAPSLNDRLIAACQAGGLSIDIVQNVSSESIRLQLVSVGMGLTFITSSTADFGVPDNVVTKPVSDLTVPLELDLAWRKGHDSPLLKSFIAVIRGIL